MKRLIAIGDIHGCYKTLRVMLDERIKPSTEDILIFLGDYIDRGPCSKQVIDHLMSLEGTGYKTFFLRGNHEQTLLDAIDKERNLKNGSWFSKPKNDIYKIWIERFGGKQAFESYGITDIKDFPKEHEEWLRLTRHYYQTDDYYFVHAGFNFTNDDILNDTDAMLWIKEFDYDAQKAGGRKVVHGHVPVSLEVLKECLAKPKLGFVPLDTGCVYTERVGMGYLSAYDFNTGELFSVKNIDR